VQATIDNMGQYSVSNLVNFAWFRTQGLADALEAAGIDPEQVTGLVPVTLNGTFGEREVASYAAPMVTVEDDAFGVEWAFYAPADLVTIEWISGSGRSFATWGRFEREAVLTVSSDHLSVYICSALAIAIGSGAAVHIMWTDDDETEAVRIAADLGASWQPDWIRAIARWVAKTEHDDDGLRDLRTALLARAPSLADSRTPGEDMETLEDVRAERAATWDAWVIAESAAALADGRVAAAHAAGDWDRLEDDGSWRVDYDSPAIHQRLVRALGQISLVPPADCFARSGREQ